MATPGKFCSVILMGFSTNIQRSVTLEALKKFNAWAENRDSGVIHPTLRLAVYHVAIKNNPSKAVEVLKDEWYNTKAIDGRTICLSALGGVKDEAIIKDTILPFLFNASPPAPASDSVPSADMHVLSASLAGNPVARPLQWQYVQDKWDAVAAKLGNPIVVDRFVQVSLPGFNNTEAVGEIEAFFEGKDTKSFDRTLETVKDKIRGRAAYRERDIEGLREWLTSTGYMS